MKNVIKPAEEYIPAQLKTVAHEILEKRMTHSKTYKVGANRYKLFHSMMPMHYPDENDELQEVDLTIEEKNGKFIVDKTFYKLEIFKDKVGYRYESRKGGVVEVSLVGGNKPIVENKGDQLFWHGVGDGLDIKIILTPYRVEIFKLLQHDKAPRKLTWSIKEDEKGHASFRRKTLGADNKANAMEINTRVIGEKVNQGKREYLYEEEWTGRVGKTVDKKTRRKEWSDKPIYPVIIDASTTEDIVNNADDGNEYVVGNIFYASPYANNILIGFAAYEFHGGFRFRTLGVPQGATINSATFKPNVTSINGTPQTKIYADDVDDAALWSASSRPSQITKTTASVAWSPVATGLASVGITSVVQEIISRASWASSNDIRFAVLNQATGTGNWLYVDDYNGGAVNAASIVVDYTAGGGGTIPHIFGDEGMIVGET